MDKKSKLPIANLYTYRGEFSPDRIKHEKLSSRICLNILSCGFFRLQMIAHI